MTWRKIYNPCWGKVPNNPKVGRIAINAGNGSVVLPASGCVIKRACSKSDGKCKVICPARRNTSQASKQQANVFCQAATVSSTEEWLYAAHWIQTLCVAVNKAASAVLMDRSRGDVKQQKKGSTMLVYSISTAFLGGTVRRITLAPEARLCGKSLDKLSLKQATWTLHICLGEGCVVCDGKGLLYSAEEGIARCQKWV